MVKHTIQGILLHIFNTLSDLPVILGKSRSSSFSKRPVSGLFVSISQGNVKIRCSYSSFPFRIMRNMSTLYSNLMVLGRFLVYLHFDIDPRQLPSRFQKADLTDLKFFILPPGRKILFQEALVSNKDPETEKKRIRRAF